MRMNWYHKYRERERHRKHYEANMIHKANKEAKRNDELLVS